MSNHILREFQGLTNDQTYVNVFSKRMMDPIPKRQGEFFGCDQRIMMMPSIQRLVADLPQNAEVFDVGAGAGEVVDFALKDAPKGTTINIEEPNPLLIQEYINKLTKYPNLKSGIAFEGTLQDYYKGSRKPVTPQNPQNLILAIHMIYHLTDFTAPKIDAEKDLIEAITFLYGLLAPGGSIFIVYADLASTDQGEAVCSMAEKYFRTQFPIDCFADNLSAIYKARNQLLGPNGTISTVLKKRYPGTNPILYAERQQSHFFGKTPEDIAVLGLATELCPSDPNPFEISKLQFCLDYVSRYPERIGLQKEEREVPQRGLWRANEPQVLSTITKAI